MKFDIFATLTCVSRPCFDFSVIFFTPSSTLDSVIGSYVSVTIIVFNVIDFNLWRFSVSIASMWVQFQTSCVSFVLLALGLCFSWITWVQDDSVQKIWFMIYIFYIYITKITFRHVSHYWRCFEEKRRRLLFNTRRPQTWRKTGWRHCFAEKASYNFFFSLRKLPQSRKNGLEAFLWRPSLQNVLFKCIFGRDGAKVTDNHNVHRNSSF